MGNKHSKSTMNSIVPEPPALQEQQKGSDSIFRSRPAGRTGRKMPVGLHNETGWLRSTSPQDDLRPRTAPSPAGNAEMIPVTVEGGWEHPQRSNLGAGRIPHGKQQQRHSNVSGQLRREGPAKSRASRRSGAVEEELGHFLRNTQDWMECASTSEDDTDSLEEESLQTSNRGSFTCNHQPPNAACAGTKTKQLQLQRASRGLDEISEESSSRSAHAKTLQRELAWAAAHREESGGVGWATKEEEMAAAVLAELRESKARTQQLLSSLSSASTRPASARSARSSSSPSSRAGAPPLRAPAAIREAPRLQCA